ncbi:MAG: hypothetical protein ACRCZI_11365 [Cetobacterium sp.]
MSRIEDDAFEEDDEESSEESSGELPLVSGVTETAPDSAPMFSKLYDLLMHRRVDSSQSHITRSLSALQDAMASEPNPMMKARLAVTIQMLREGPSA